jgi:putative Mg2+ transporter-C (MgtC) family protein
MASSAWQLVRETFISEFSDLTDAAEVTRILLRLTLAALLGGLLGIEREQHGKAAGVRTHMLVAMGSALFVLLSLQAGMSGSDLSRVMQGIIAGIGFLGAGTILKGDDEEKVKGLTTAAGIWLTAAIGVAAGMGRESTAVLSTLLALAIFSLMPRLVGMLDKPKSLVVKAANPPEDKQ